MNSQIKFKRPKICIVGPGIVGQATGKAFALQGFETVFLGGNDEKTNKLRREGYKAYRRNELFDGRYDFDISFLTVPTPTTNGEISLAALKSASIDLGKRLAFSKRYHLVVVKSTVPPGTTENLVVKMVEKYSGKKVGDGLGVCMNPEYLREKTASEDALKPWIIVIGQFDKKSGDILNSVYSKFDCPIFRCSIREAEMQKYVHNIYNATKITFFNDIRNIAKEIEVDAEKIFKLVSLSAEGMWNPEYGIRDYGPFQGSCLPKDTKAFLAYLKKRGLKADLLEVVLKINDSLVKNLGLKEDNLEVGSRL